MSKPKVAIAIPVYNGAATLEKAMQSIADQDFQNFRAYIIENKSTDNSVEIAKAFCKKDSRFEIVENEVHLNMIDNFIQAIQYSAAQAEYFCLRACDDIGTPDYVSKLVAALDADKTKLLAASDAERITGELVKRVRPNPNIFNFSEKILREEIPRNLQFPSEWIYGVFRSDEGAEILLQRWPELGGPWAAASYAVCEFVVRDKVAYVEGPVYKIFVGSDSVKLYFVKGWLQKFKQRMIFAMGCFRIRKKLPKMSWYAKFRYFVMCWNDSRRKTRYVLLGIQKLPKITY